MRSRVLVSVALFASLVACGGNNKPADDAWSDPPRKEDKPFRETEALGRPPEDRVGKALSMWLGVRHDLALAQTTNLTEKCSCLAVEVGAPGDPKFAWQGGEMPKLDTRDAIAIAITANGVTCAGGPAAGARRASISAVDRENDDVLVEIEEIPDGRPIASGAIIPKPGPNGAVYVRPKNRNVPYARGNGVGQRCRVQ